MKKIKKLVCRIKDEIESASYYSEKYLESKIIDGDNSLAQKYKEASLQELSHAELIHSVAEGLIQKMSKVVTPPMDMLEKWNECHEEYIESVNEIKSMLK